MDSDNLGRIEEIFHAAVEMAADEQNSYLEAACGDDKQLRREVESLLEFESTADHFLDEAPTALAAEMLAEQSGPKKLVGKTILHYKIVQLLGIGGMGEVYLAEDARLDRRVALKLLPDVFSGDRGRLERFILEARSASGLNHPNIITIHEIGESEGRNFISTEFVEGKTLRELVASGRLPVTSALDVAIQMASALEKAHSVGIVHRDIKPDNIMVRPDGLVKVLDFGVAKLMELSGRKDPDGRFNPSQPPTIGGTIAGSIVGTPNYMSTEQASGDPVDPRSDIFSFGAVVYEMLSGRRAFSGDDAAEAIEAILHHHPVPLSAAAPGIPAAIESIVSKCLEKRPVDRYQQIGDVLSDLRSAKRRLEYNEIEANHSTGDLAAGTTREIMTPGRSGTRPNRRSLYVAGSLVAVLIALGSFVGYRNFTSSDEIRSIAVIPFRNEGGDPEMDYLSDGMTENLIRSLSTLQGLSVKARSTVFTYKGKDVAPSTVGDELNVDTVLLGRLEQSEDGLRLDLELVETATQNVLWSAEYSRGVDELVLLQRIVARDVADRLRPALTAADKLKIAQNYSTTSEAQQLYLKGRFHWNKRTVKDLERAAQYFDQALEKDKGYALAYAGAADTYALMPIYGNYQPLEYIPKAKQAALKALELDRNLAEAHASLGYITTTYDYDWDRAETEYLTAMRLRPGYATAHQWYAEHLAFRGRTEEALENISIALELDPFSLVINRMKGNILGFAGRYEEAIDQLNRTVDLHPESPVVRFNLGEAYAAREMYPEAIEQFLTGFRLEGRKNYEIRRYENAYKLRGWKGFWMEYLASLITLQEAINDAEEKIYFDNESLAYAYAATGNKEKAIDFLYKAYEARDPHLVTIRTSEVYDFLRDDPRYIELIAKIGLPR